MYHAYSATSDVWSGGCVVGEMMRGSVLFQGRDTMHQIKLIFSCLGEFVGKYTLPVLKN